MATEQDEVTPRSVVGRTVFTRYSVEVQIDSDHWSLAYSTDDRDYALYVATDNRNAGITCRVIDEEA